MIWIGMWMAFAGAFGLAVIALMGVNAQEDFHAAKKVAGYWRGISEALIRRHKQNNAP